MAFDNRKVEVCIAQLYIIRKSQTPSENRLTAILNRKKPKFIPGFKPGLLGQNASALPHHHCPGLFILTQALFYYQLSAIILSSLITLMQIILSEVREVLKPSCACEAILNLFFNLSLT